MYKRNYDSFWLYWLRVSMYKRNHIENDVVMVATELISHVVLPYPWDLYWIMNHIYDYRGMSNIDFNVRLWVILGHYRVFVDEDTGIHEPLNRSEFSKRGSRNPRTADPLWIFKGGDNNPRTAESVWILKGDEGIHKPPNRSEFLKVKQEFTDGWTSLYF